MSRTPCWPPSHEASARLKCWLGAFPAVDPFKYVCGYCKIFERAHATRARHTRTPHARYSNTPYSLSATPSGQPEAASLYVSAQRSPARPRAARSLALCRTHAQSRTHASHTHASHTHTHTRCTHAHILYTQRKRDIAPLLTRRPPPDGPRLDGQRVRWLCAGRTRALRKQTHTRTRCTRTRCTRTKRRTHTHVHCSCSARVQTLDSRLALDACTRTQRTHAHVTHAHVTHAQSSCAPFFFLLASLSNLSSKFSELFICARHTGYGGADGGGGAGAGSQTP